MAAPLSDEERDAKQRATWAAQKRRQRAARRARRSTANPMLAAGWRKVPGTREWVPARASEKPPAD